MIAFASYQAALQVLQAAQRPLFILLCDVDADALGSAVALSRGVMSTGAVPTLFCIEDIPESLQFLLADGTVIHDKGALDFTNHDLAIVVDAGSLARTGLADELRAFMDAGQPLLNIDHHHAHEDFGTVNLIDEEASATAVLAYDLLKYGGWDIDAATATAILSGISADTGNFTNAGTTTRALMVAAACYGKGAEVRQVIRGLYQHRSLLALKLWGEILGRLQENRRWGLAATVILQDDFKKLGMTPDDAEGVANFMNAIPNIKAALVLTELPNGEIRGSLRTTRDDVDVSKLATHLGGGGHKKAAGFTITGKIVQSAGGWKVIAGEVASQKSKTLSSNAKSMTE